MSDKKKNDIDVTGATLTAAPSVSAATTRHPEGDAPDRTALPFVDPANYTVGEELARGGMGRILSARDRRLGRPVAIKELLGSGEILARRFEREAFITARLQHPGIVAVYEAGRWPGGEPFYAMKLVAGRSLKDVILSTRTLDDRLALLPNVISVVEALAYAHEQGIVHRDLKPANILVGAFGETVVIDWGLAKEVGAADLPTTGGTAPTEGDSLTVAGAIMGTPAYMPVEQARGRDIDQRSDVYALGAILYHVLAGAPPYDGDSSATIIAQLEHGPPPALTERQNGVPRDLIAIVDKAMSRDAAKRYPSAKQLAEELRRFQTGQLVAAHSYSSTELVRRWIRKNRAPLFVATVAAVILVAGAGASYMNIVRERDQARDRADETLIAQARGSLERDPVASLTALEDLSPGTSRWPAARMIAADAVARGLPRILRGHEGPVNRLAFSPDGRFLASAGDDKTIRMWEVGPGTLYHTLEGHADQVNSLAFSKDGWKIASGGEDKEVRIWDIVTWGQSTQQGHASEVELVAFTPDGQRLVSLGRGAMDVWEVGGGLVRTVPAQEFLSDIDVTADASKVITSGIDGTLRLWDTATGETRILNSSKGTIAPVDAISPDGTLAAVAGSDKSISVIPTGGGSATVLTGHNKNASVLKFSPDGKSLASGDLDGAVRLWTLKEGKWESRQLLGHEGRINRLAFTTDGSSLASAGDDRTVRVWNTATGEARVFRGHGGSIRHIAFSPDGKTLATACEDGNVRLFDLSATGGHVLGHQDGGIAALAFSPDGKSIAAGGGDYTVTIRPLDGGKPTPLFGHQGTLAKMAYSADGTLVTTGLDKSVRRWDPKTRKSVTLRGRVHPRLAVGRTGRFLAAPAAGPGKVRLWEIASGRGLVFDAGGDWIDGVALDPAERRLAACGRDGLVRVWDIGGGPPRVLEGEKEPFRFVAFTPDGRFLVAAGEGKTAFAWDDVGQRRLIPLPFSEVTALAVSPDGHEVVFGGKDGALALLDLSGTGVPRLLAGHTGYIHDLAFSPTGRSLASASDDATVRLWDVASGESRVLRGHEGAAVVVAFSPDGRLLASGGQEGDLRLWSDELPNDGPAFGAWLARAVSEARGAPSWVSPKR